MTKKCENAENDESQLGSVVRQTSRSTRRRTPRPETRRQDLRRRDRDETRDVQLRDRDETETLSILSETRPRRDFDTSRDRLETETSRPRLHPWLTEHCGIANAACPYVTLAGLCQSAINHSFKSFGSTDSYIHDLF
jgi:hypothetical protein